MAWTYNKTSISTDLAKVRLLIGDTDFDDQQLSDSEVNAAISLTDDIYAAAAWLCRALASKYARQIDTSIESVSRKASQRSAHYTSLAYTYEQRSAVQGGGLGTPYVGGVSESAMDSVEEDSDRVQPAFKRGQFENPPEDDVDPEWNA